MHMNAEANTPPPPEALAAILGPSSNVIRFAEIYESDGSLWKSYSSIGVLDGQVSVDSTRKERRTLQMVLDNTDDSLYPTESGLWYDKVIKVWRGVEWEDPDEPSGYAHWAVQIGEFLIDEIKQDHFPHTVSITGRDYTKRLILSKFVVATSFAVGQPIEDVIRAIAINGGIDPDKIMMPLTGKETGKVWVFERGTERWTAMTDIATNHGYELYFDGNGFLIMREFQDPVTSPVRFTFQTGEEGSMVAYTKTTRDVRIYNKIVVTGESANAIPVWAVAENHEASSYTSIEEIGERVYQYTSSFIRTTEQAQEVADKFLKIHSLEEYDVTISSIVLPWLEAADIVEFIDPNAHPGDPTRFLLSSFTIPLRLQAMSSVAKRVVIVG